jgi:hypothetical protein
MQNEQRRTTVKSSVAAAVSQGGKAAADRAVRCQVLFSVAQECGRRSMLLLALFKMGANLKLVAYFLAAD